MISDAKVAVIGGGVAGCSLLYHLAKLGWTDTVLLERNELTSGTTWHAAGLCTQFGPSYNLMGLLQYSVELYQELDAGFHPCGSLRLAGSGDRLDEFSHVAGIARQLGIPLEIISPAEAQELFPLLEPRGVLGAAYLPTDGHVDPARLTNAYAKGASEAGTRILRGTPVTEIERRKGTWIVTGPGPITIEAEIVVCAAGLWSREVARLAGSDLPVVPLAHQYVLTEPIDEVRAREVELPVLRDPERSFYVRQDGDGLLVGPFERSPRSLDRTPRGGSRLLEPDLGHILDVLGAAEERLPALGGAAITKTIHGPDGYTPDGRCLMGPVPGLRDFHVLCGFSIFGIVFSGGAGRYAAEWIVEGQPSDNMWELDVRRFGEYALSRPYLVSKACEVYEREYAIRYPEEELPAGRPLRTDLLYDTLRAKGAVFGARFGWERPLWFAGEGPPADAYTFRRGNWFDAVGEECRSVRSAVGVLDQTSFAKYEVSGPGAEPFLDRLCTNSLPSEGRIAPRRC